MRPFGSLSYLIRIFCLQVPQNIFLGHCTTFLALFYGPLPRPDIASLLSRTSLHGSVCNVTVESWILVVMARPKNTSWATNYNFKKIHDDNFSIRYASIDLNIYTITFIQVLLLFLWGFLWFRLWYFCWCGSRWCQSLVRGVFRDNSCGTSFGKNGSYRIDNSYSWKEKTNMGLEIVFCNFCDEECLKTSLNSSLHIHSSILFAFFLFSS